MLAPFGQHLTRQTTSASTINDFSLPIDFSYEADVWGRVRSNVALASQQTALNIWQRRMLASVLLIKALGGGWDVSKLPSPRDLAR